MYQGSRDIFIPIEYHYNNTQKNIALREGQNQLKDLLLTLFCRGNDSTS